MLLFGFKRHVSAGVQGFDFRRNGWEDGLGADGYVVATCLGAAHLLQPAWARLSAKWSWVTSINIGK